MKSYGVGLRPSVGNGSDEAPDPPMSDSRPHWTVEFSTPGALEIMSNTMFPCGRSKKMPQPPRMIVEPEPERS